MCQIYVSDCINYTLGTVSKHALGLGFGLGLGLGIWVRVRVRFRVRARECIKYTLGSLSIIR